MAVCTEGKSIPTFDHISCSDMTRSPSADVSTFMPSMIAMLTEEYLPDAPSSSDIINLSTNANEVDNYQLRSGEQKNDQNINTEGQCSPVNCYRRTSRENLSDDSLPGIPRKSRDILLSQQKLLPDINCFIRDQSNISRPLETVTPMSIDDNEEHNDIFRHRNSSNDSLVSLCIDTETYSPDESEQGSPVFTDLTESKTGHSTSKWGGNCSKDDKSNLNSSEIYPYFAQYSQEYGHIRMTPVKIERQDNVHCDLPLTQVGDCSIRNDFNKFGNENRKLSDNFTFDNSQMYCHTDVQSCPTQLSPQFDSCRPTDLRIGHCKSQPCLYAEVKTEHVNQNENPHHFYPVTEHFQSPQTTNFRSTGVQDIYFPENVPENINIHMSNSNTAINSTNTFSPVRQDSFRHRNNKVNSLSTKENPKASSTTDKQDEVYYRDDPMSCLEIEDLVGPCMEEMKGIILKEVVKDVDVACKSLELDPNPQLWSEDQVEKWVVWTMSQYSLPFLDSSLFRIKGSQLCDMNEDQMRSLAPKCGDFLHAHLEIWRTVVESGSKDGGAPSITLKESKNDQDIMSGNSTCSFDYFSGQTITTTKKEFPALPEYQRFESGGRVEPDENSVTIMTPNHTAGIHLWQFLKELLLQPHMYGQCIRWMDKQNGIFKIEDSVEVARLWGIRKNRPAMNYDKLSRSIRQYYKKGIIKKTEVSQRLVYQFVKPVI